MSLLRSLIFLSSLDLTYKFGTYFANGCDYIQTKKRRQFQLGMLTIRIGWKLCMVFLNHSFQDFFDRIDLTQRKFNLTNSLESLNEKDFSVFQKNQPFFSPVKHRQSFPFQYIDEMRLND